MFFMAYIFVGLGNPGEEYLETRHNAGRIALEYAAKKFGGNEWEFNKKLNARVVNVKIGKKAGNLFVEPETFMNKSGVSVKPLITSVKKAESLVVIHDDLDLPIGRLKVSFNKSAGGHKGVESIIKAVKTEAFIRIRIGISPVTVGGKLKKPDHDDVTDNFIVANFKPKELEVIKKDISKKIAEVMEILVQDGLGQAMTIGNRVD